jgi:hypothetical protein
MRYRRKHLVWMLILSWYFMAGVLLVAEQLSVNKQWKFQFDLAKAGAAKGWGTPGFDDSVWQTVAAGKSWADFGYFDYDGVAWYRKKIQVPRNSRDNSSSFRVSRKVARSIWMASKSLTMAPTAGLCAMLLALPAGPGTCQGGAVTLLKFA